LSELGACLFGGDGGDVTESGGGAIEVRGGQRSPETAATAGVGANAVVVGLLSVGDRLALSVEHLDLALAVGTQFLRRALVSIYVAFDLILPNM
jgi:hypothetical protein